MNDAFQKVEDLDVCGVLRFIKELNFKIIHFRLSVSDTGLRMKTLGNGYKVRSTRTSVPVRVRNSKQSRKIILVERRLLARR